jgi:hypothetical protein
MNTANSSSIEGVDLAIVELQRQIGESIDLLAPERLHVLADFAAYLVNAETQELSAIPGLLERVKQNQATSKTSYVNWRNIRADI